MCTVLKFSLNASVSVTYEYLHSFCTAQILFVTFLDTEVAAIVARCVVVVTFNVTC